MNQNELEIQNEELRKISKTLEISESRYHNLYDLAPVGYFTIDIDGRILEMNLTGAKLFGIERSVLINQQFTSYILKDDQDIYYLHNKNLFNTCLPATYEVRIVKKNGESFWSILQCIIANDMVMGKVCRIVMSNIAAQRQLDDDKFARDESYRIFRENAEEELRTLNCALEKRAIELELTNQELEAFSYSVSHDLRNPLNAITTNIEVLTLELGDSIGTDVKTALDYILQSAHRMARVISDLMTLSGISSLNITSERVNLSDIVNALLSELQTGNPRSSISLSITAGLTAEGDPGLLRQLIINLVRNAWKFTALNEDTHIEFGRTKKGDLDCFYIKDNGIGFDMKDKEKLFKPFKRLHSSADYKGSGIGLAIVKRIVDKHNGVIWGESEIGNGATFFFTINK